MSVVNASVEVWNRFESVGTFESFGVMSRESNVEALENDSGDVLVRRKVQQEGREKIPIH